MKSDYNSLVNSFLEYLALELNYASSTINTYNQILKDYAQFLKTHNLNVLHITSDEAKKYKAYLISSKYDNKTSSLHLSCVRSFYNFLVEIKYLATNPYRNLKNPKIAKKLPNFLKDSETNTLFNNISNLDALEFRNVFIIEFLYATGLRVSELCNIKLTDIDFSEQTIRVMGKGSKERLVFFKALDNSIINKYLEVRSIILETPSSYFIVGKKGKLTPRTIENIVKKYAFQNNLKGKVTPHTMRHTYATDLLNNGADIRSVGELLGHSSLSTTQIYTHISSERLKSVYNKTHPRA